MKNHSYILFCLFIFSFLVSPILAQKKGKVYDKVQEKYRKIPEKKWSWLDEGEGFDTLLAEVVFEIVRRESKLDDTISLFIDTETARCHTRYGGIAISKPNCHCDSTFAPNGLHWLVDFCRGYPFAPRQLYEIREDIPKTEVQKRWCTYTKGNRIEIHKPIGGWEWIHAIGERGVNAYHLYLPVNHVQTQNYKTLEMEVSGNYQEKKYNDIINNWKLYKIFIWLGNEYHPIIFFQIDEVEEIPIWVH